MWLTTSPRSCAECHEIRQPKTPGTLWATPGLLRDSFTFKSLPQKLTVKYRHVCLDLLFYVDEKIDLQRRTEVADSKGLRRVFWTEEGTTGKMAKKIA